MSDIKVITERDLKGANPLFPSSGYSQDFILLNMYPDGIWLVDKQCTKFEDIKKTAIEIAKMFGDKRELEKLEKL